MGWRHIFIIDTQHFLTAAKKIKRGTVDGITAVCVESEGKIPMTSNCMETFFQKARRNLRKRCGNIAIGNVLKRSGDLLALL
ncbi:MAG: hypothetical protein QW478_11465 [Candidatus Micrarchaeaceae archaeon]